MDFGKQMVDDQMDARLSLFHNTLTTMDAGLNRVGVRGSTSPIWETAGRFVSGGTGQVH